jgi:thioredoxin-like negative regulator of GroEL
MLLNMLIWALVSFAMLLGDSRGLEEASDGSVCFNNCSGHGSCLDYSCTCFEGYFGDDCRHTFADEANIVPILTAGHFNVTRKDFKSTLSKNPLILVGYSSYACHKCIRAEVDYKEIAEEMTTLGIPFARADSVKLQALAQEHGVNELPALVFFRKGRPIPYKGIHNKDSVLEFLRKITSNPVKTLKTVPEVMEFMDSYRNREHSLSTVMVTAFFREHEDVEEDEYSELMDAAKALRDKEDIYISVVKVPKTSQWFIDNKRIDRTPSLALSGESGEWITINLNELYGEGLNIEGWIIKNSIPLVGKLVGQNFAMYEKLGLPMLLMFLDLEHEDASAQPGRIVGGKSGGILNEQLLQELRGVAKEHNSKISFVYLDGNLHKDKMRSLGLFGGRERLPSLAFNTKDNRQIPFSEKLPINEDTLLQFCADFLSGKLQSAADAEEAARKALQSAAPMNQRNKAKRKRRLDAPDQVTGVAEQFGDGNKGDDVVVVVDKKNFDAVVMDEEKDVLLLLHAKECEPCAHLSVYYKRMAERFSVLNIPSLVVARMDVTDDSPPAHLNLMTSELPIIVLLQATANIPGSSGGGKTAPWVFFSGIGKVQTLMKWVQKHAAVPFELPNLPHLNDEQVGMYKEQVRQREEHMDDKRKKEIEDMEQEEEARRKADDKRRAQQLKQKQLEEENELDDEL